MARPTPERQADPLAPVEFIVNVLGSLTLLVVLAVALTGVLGSGDGFLGGEDVCVTSQPILRGEQDQTFESGQLSGGADTRWTMETLHACAQGPDASQRILYATVSWTPMVFWIGLLVWLRSLVRRGRKHGMFTEEFAQGTTRLGAYLLVGGAAVGIMHGLAHGMFVATLLADAGWFHGSWSPALPLSALVAGFGLLTIGRVLHLAVAMRADLEATI